jgi:hypothetical protein
VRGAGGVGMTTPCKHGIPYLDGAWCRQGGHPCTGSFSDVNFDQDEMDCFEPEGDA